MGLTMPPSNEEFAREVAVEIEFESRILEVLDRYATGTGVDRRTALHWAIVHAHSEEAQRQRKQPTWQWVFPGVGEDDEIAARQAVEGGTMVAAWRTDPALAEAGVAVWRLPSTYWACTVITRFEPDGPEQWRCLPAGTFAHAALLGSQAIATLSYQLAARAKGPIWTTAEGDWVTDTGWEGYLDPDLLGEAAATPPSWRPEPAEADGFEAMIESIEEAGKRAVDRGRGGLAPEIDDGQLDARKQWSEVIESRGGRRAASAIGADILRWLSVCHELGRIESEADGIGHDYAAGRRVGTAEAHAANARKAWIKPLLAMSGPFH